MRRLSDESVKAKTGFLANLSHEIRGPLGVVMNAVELNLDGLLGELNDAQRETLEMVKINSNHLLDLVNDVLDYAKVEAGKITVTPAPLEVKELLDELARVVQTQAHAKKHDLQVREVPEDLFVTCDRRHARQMLINLLTNAVKYTPEGGKIEVGAERDEEGMIKLWVKDSGVGIPFSERSKVFGAFERIESGYASQQTGTGLGMPLTRSLARVNGGTVDFDSIEGQGSTFWVILPQTEAPSAEQSAEADAENRIVSGHGVGLGERIVLFDPSDETGSMVERYLSHQGFSVVRSTLSEQLPVVVMESKPQLVVLDYDPAATEGENVLESLRAEEGAGQVPILLLTARAFLFDIEDSLRLGVDRCLTKPVSLKDLAAAIRSLLDETSRLSDAADEQGAGMSP
jgi:CheY-like chemotaxis protein